MVLLRVGVFDECPRARISESTPRASGSIRDQEWVHYPAEADDVLLPLPAVLRPRVVP